MDILEQVIRNQVEQIVETSSKQYAEVGIGLQFEFDGTGFRELPVSPELKDNLIYDNVTVHTDDVNILIVRDNHPIYGFHVDSEGAEKTMEHDFTHGVDVVNYNMAVASLDVDSVVTMMSDLTFMARFQDQLIAGFKKGKENGHY